LLSEAPEGASLALLGADLLDLPFDRPNAGPKVGSRARVGCQKSARCPRLGAQATFLTLGQPMPLFRDGDDKRRDVR
jgi:hypothetical protein